MSRQSVWRILDNPVVWEISRVGLDLALGLYRRRIATLGRWGVLENAPAVLDVGCGTGGYCSITRGPYLGLDLQPRYVRYAQRRRAGPDRSFRAADVAEVAREEARFDLALLVDVLHHLDIAQCVDLLRAVGHVSRGHVASFEPVAEQPRWLGRWIVGHDRGAHVRTLVELEELFRRSGLGIVESTPLWLGPIHTRAILARAAFEDGR